MLCNRGSVVGTVRGSIRLCRLRSSAGTARRRGRSKLDDLVKTGLGSETVNDGGFCKEKKMICQGSLEANVRISNRFQYHWTIFINGGLFVIPFIFRLTRPTCITLLPMAACLERLISIETKDN